LFKLGLVVLALIVATLVGLHMARADVLQQMSGVAPHFPVSAMLKATAASMLLAAVSGGRPMLVPRAAAVLAIISLFAYSQGQETMLVALILLSPPIGGVCMLVFDRLTTLRRMEKGE
jgi:hypothetical protein